MINRKKVVLGIENRITLVNLFTLVLFIAGYTTSINKKTSTGVAILPLSEYEATILVKTPAT